MISAKASYWIAVGLLALFVSNHFAGHLRMEFDASPAGHCWQSSRSPAKPPG